MSEKKLRDQARWGSVKNGLVEWNSKDASLGRGVFGEVYKYKYHGTPVAVKKIIIKGDTTRYGVYTLEQKLAREIETLSSMRHPNIVCMIAYTNDLIVMELYDGPLSKISSMKEFSFVARECTRALSFMQHHDVCMFHGDIKPDNILVNRDNNGEITRVALGDLGISRECSPDTGFVGTPGYMPHPDQGMINNLADLFALGVSLMDSYFSTKVHASYPEELMDNTMQHAMRLKGPVDVIVGEMLSAYKNDKLASRQSVYKSYVMSILEQWEHIHDSYDDNYRAFDSSREEDHEVFETAMS